MSGLIFSVSGLRGVVNKDLFPETVQEFARAFGEFVGRGRLAVGRDARLSGAELVRAAKAGLAEAGCSVVDLGICPTPTVVHFVRQQGLPGGLVITASHNPAEWNGMKFVHGKGRFLSPEEFNIFQAQVAKVKFDRARGTKSTSASEEVADGVAGHIAAIIESSLLQGIRGDGLRIGVDAVDGAASFAAPQLLTRLGCEVREVFCSPGTGKGFPRAPEPKAENLTVLAELVRKEGLDAGFAFDPDGDRFSCVDEMGVPLGEEATLALAALFVLNRRKGPVVVNLSTSRMIEDIAQRFGVAVARTKVGEAFVVQGILERGAVLGGEGNGGVILPEVNLTRDGLVAAALLVALMKTSGKRLSELRQELPEYHIAKATVPAGKLEAEEFIARLEGKLPFTGIDRTEGVRLMGADWWAHIRKSNTEPIVRVVAEARTRQKVENILQVVTRMVAPS
ncbi:phosphoglucosamine mutase [candidate division WOR-3 bacterium]|nr:phosphoglucosamine mutase [candidate division WOR-3 bacterium]